MVLKNIIVLFVSKFRIRFRVLIRIVGLGFDNGRKSLVFCWYIVNGVKKNNVIFCVMLVYIIFMNNLCMYVVLLVYMYI